MSKGRPYTPKAVPEQPKAPGPVDVTVVPRTCSDCKFWRTPEPGDAPDRKGLCTKGPASMSLGVIGGIGPVLTYGYTAANLVACGEARPK